MDVDIPLEIIVDHSLLTLMANYAGIGLWNDEYRFLSFRQESRIYLESYKFFIYPRYTKDQQGLTIKPALGLHVLHIRKIVTCSLHTLLYQFLCCLCYMYMYIYVIPLQFHIDYQGRLKRFTNILNHLVSTDMDFTQLDAYLTSQMRRRQVSTSTLHCKHACDQQEYRYHRIP